MGCSGAGGGQLGNEYVLHFLRCSNHSAEHSIFFEEFADSSHSAVYRLNTYPLIHLGFFHMLLNTIALAPLLERFEADHGTLLTAAMFVGRTSSLTCRNRSFS